MKSLKAFRNWWSMERGISSAAVMILSLPLILGAFGFGFDLMRVAYAKRYSQGRLDLAVQTAASITYTTSDGYLRLGKPGAGGDTAWRDWGTKGAYYWYATNTATKRSATSNTSLFNCAAEQVRDGDASAVRNPDGTYRCYGLAEKVGIDPDNTFDFCGKTGTAKGARSVYGVKYTVHESTPTLFLKMIGIPEISYKVSSESLIRQRNC